MKIRFLLVCTMLTLQFYHFSPKFWTFLMDYDLTIARNSLDVIEVKKDNEG